MKTKYFIFAALVATGFASCTNDDFVGDLSPNVTQESVGDGGINFGGGFRAVTRAKSYDKAAADLLGAEFIVEGVKGDGTGSSQTEVFPSYTVNWVQNTAGTTESNTADWEYVNKNNYFSLAGSQAIKYWDYSTTAYDFCAYSVGSGNTLITSGTPTSGQILASAISYANAGTAAYTLRGARADLTKCYITDMKTVAKIKYKEEVELEFRSLATKVRMAIYETVPGYSVKDVYFYQNDTDPITTDVSSNTDATLFGTNAFNESGIYTVTFPKIGSSNASDPDYNQAHVAISGATTSSTQAFGTLNYAAGEDALSGNSIYLKRTSSDPSFAGSSTYYQTMLPDPTGHVLEMRVNYTLVPNDGAAETITIHGAKAFIPAAYTKWLPNFAYTYIFKISDNTNGWSSTSESDPAGLFPITFDAVVLDSETTGTQTTITTVATPSITTYQKGHVYSTNNEYAAGDIYVQVMDAGTLKSDLNATSPLKKSYLYTLTGVSNPTEALVMDALNIRASESGTPATIVGRNGLTLTPADYDATVTAIPGEDGNNITVSAGQAVKFAATASTTYAYVYQVSEGSAGDVKTTVVLTSEPTDWNASDNVYYTDAACTTKANAAYADGTYYKKYTDLNNVYAVKVIKVQ